MTVKTIYKPASINKKLKIEVLEYALILEENINNLLVELLDIPDKNKKKSLSGKSGSLSFKNKIDLLFDLGVIDNDEHKELLILMEFRNKFLHDLHCNSFEKALSLYRGQRNNTMLNLVYGVQSIKNINKKERDEKITEYNSKPEEEKEQICIESYGKLFERSVEIVTEKTKLSEEKYDLFIDIAQEFYKSGLFFKDRYVHVMKELFELCKNPDAKEEIVQYIENESRYFLSSKEAEKHIDTLQNVNWIPSITPKRRLESQQAEGHDHKSNNLR